MTDKILHKQDTAMLEEIVGILQRRASQYGCAFVQGVFIKEEDGSWRNGVTKVTALREQPAAPLESLNYGNVVYHEATISVKDLQTVVESLAHEGVLKIDDYIVPPALGPRAGVLGALALALQMAL